MPSLLWRLVKGFVGRFAKELLEIDDVQLEINAGTLELRNVQVRKAVFDKLGLPLTVTHGVVDHVKVTVLSVSDVRFLLEIEGVNMVCKPLASVEAEAREIDTAAAARADPRSAEREAGREATSSPVRPTWWCVTTRTLCPDGLLSLTT